MSGDVSAKQYYIASRMFRDTFKVKSVTLKELSVLVKLKSNVPKCSAVPGELLSKFTIRKAIRMERVI